MTTAGRASDESPDESQDIGSDAQPPPSDGSQTETSHQDLISRRAYERFQMRGAEHGRDQDDRLEAERELNSALLKGAMMQMNPSHSPFRIVCLGGSAGALPAYQAILRAVPADSGMAFIVVAHRRLGFDHLLGPLLEAVTTMPVSTVEQGQCIAPNAVVLVPAQHDVAIVDGRLVLSTRAKTVGWPITITSFLESLAIDGGTRAVAVILSGLADDGSAALGAIKAGGGATFAQADAEWQDMPRHAIETGFVDFVLSSKNIGRALTLLSEAAPH